MKKSTKWQIASLVMTIAWYGIISIMNHKYRKAVKNERIANLKKGS